MPCGLLLSWAIKEDQLLNLTTDCCPALNLTKCSFHFSMFDHLFDSSLAVQCPHLHLKDYSTLLPMLKGRARPRYLDLDQDLLSFLVWMVYGF